MLFSLVVVLGLFFFPYIRSQAFLSDNFKPFQALMLLSVHRIPSNLHELYHSNVCPMSKCPHSKTQRCGSLSFAFSRVYVDQALFSKHQLFCSAALTFAASSFFHSFNCCVYVISAFFGDEYSPAHLQTETGVVEQLLFLIRQEILP